MAAIDRLAQRAHGRPVRREQTLCGVGGVEIETGEPAQRSRAGARRQGLAGVFGRVQADEVVHPVAAR